MDEQVKMYLLERYSYVETVGYLKKKDAYVFNSLRKMLKRKFLVFRNIENGSYRIVLAINRFDSLYLMSIRKKIQEKLKSFKNVVFVTYTFAVDVPYKEAKKMISNHINNIRKRYPEYCVDYITFVDFTKSDRIHFHVIYSTNIEYRYRRSKGRVYIEKTSIYESMKNVYSWKHGYVDVQGVDSVSGAVKYIMKYMTKMMTKKDIQSVYHMCKLVYHNIRTYSCSRKRLDNININSVKVKKYELISCTERDVILPLFGLKYYSMLLKYMSDDYKYRILYIDISNKIIIDFKFIEKNT